MKKMIRIALALVLALSLLIAAALAEEVVSDKFNILDEITVKTEQPAEEQPAGEQPAEEQPTQEPLPTEPPLPTVEPMPTEEPVPTGEPVTTEEPAATEEPLPTEEPAATEEPLPTEEAPAEQPLPERSLSITSNIPADEVEIGDVVHLTAILNGYEGAEVSIAWERLVDGVWQPTGDTGRLVEFTVDEENLHGSWRFTATVISEAQPAAEEAAQ